jgi:hypothetical protein
VQQRESKRLATPEAPGWPADDFSADLGHGDELVDPADSTEETRTPTNHEPLPPAIDALDRGTRDQLLIVVEGTRLRQGSTYVDLDNVRAGPFKALAGQVTEPGQRLVPKHRVDHELWNALVPRDRE